MQWDKDMCRICGQISEIFNLIYNNKESSLGLEEKIKKCFHFELFEADYKPKKVCYTCTDKLDEFSNFIDICYTTNQKLESLYFINSQEWHNKSACNYSQHQTKHQSVIVSNKQGIENDLNFYKTNDNTNLDSFNVPNINRNEVLTFPSSNNESYMMQNGCETYFNEPNKLLSFQTTVLRHSQNDGSTIEEHSDLLNMVNFRSQEKDCEFYTNLSVPVDEINLNDKMKPTSNNLISVEEVKKLISSEPLSNILVNTEVKNKKTFQCPHCDRFFMRRGSLNAHMSVHTNIKPYTCSKCSKSFAVKTILTTHEKSHSSEHMCKVCSKTFTVPSKLERHMRIHTHEKPFTCDFEDCFKAFSDKRNLEAHKCIHGAERNFACEVCKKTFKTKHKLSQHVKVHVSNVRYKCNLCSKNYKHRTNLVSHLKKHNLKTNK